MFFLNYLQKLDIKIDEENSESSYPLKSFQGKCIGI